MYTCYDYPIGIKMLTSSKNQDFLLFLRMMSKKGFYDMLNHISGKGSVHYNALLKFALEKKIIDSAASVTIILNGLTNLGLLERTVTNTRPLRTTYKVSKNGQKVLKNFGNLETLF